MTGFVVLALLAAAPVIILGSMFLRRASRGASSENNWQQRDGSEMPSLSNYSAPQTLSDVDVGLGAHVDGDR